MVCRSLGITSREPGSGVDERVKAFLGSAATVYQYRQGVFFGGRSSTDRI
jgi:hypothetical protein